MDSIPYRNNARNVSYAELLGSLVALIFAFLGVSYAFLGMFVKYDKVGELQRSVEPFDRNLHHSHVTTEIIPAFLLESTIVTILGYLGAQLILVCAQVYVNVMLYKATDVDAEMKDAEKQAALYRNYTMGSTVICMIVLALTQKPGLVVVVLAIRAVFLYIVHKYVQGIQEAIIREAEEPTACFHKVEVDDEYTT